MTIQSSTSRVSYNGDNVSTVFTVPFPFFANTDLLITQTDAAGGITTISSAIIAGAGNPSGGTVTLLTPLATGTKLGIFLSPAITQLSHYISNAAFPASTLESDLDKSVQVDQFLQEQINNSIRVDVGEIAPQMKLPSVAVRKSTNLGFDASGNLAVSAALNSGTLSQAAIGGFLYGTQTAAESTAVITPTNTGYNEGDIRRYGALLAAGDNSAAINAALLVSSTGGNAVFVPAGTWAYTSTLNAVGGSSMYGVGQASRLAPNGCDGITFGTQGTYEGTRFFRDFEINAVNGTANNGIICDFSAASGNRITQVHFARLTIQNFKQGVYAHGMWNPVFDNCWLYNNYQGYWFYGQNIQPQIRGGFCQEGALTGSGTQIGLNVTTNTPTNNESTQSLKAVDFGVYGYDINVNLALSQYLMLEHCDISVAKVTGVNMVSCAGGTIIRDCWIQTNSASATTGIAIPALGAAINDKVVIDGCTIICNLANAGSIGVNVGNNHNAVSVTNNTIGTVTQPWAQGLVNNNCNNTSFKNNTIYATSVAVSIHSSSINAELGPNIIQNGTQVFTGATPVGFTYYGSGSYVINLTGISGVTATVTWVANGRTVRHTLLSAGATGAASGGAATLVSTGDIPAILWPVTTRGGILRVLDNSVNIVGFFGLTNAGVLTLFSGLSSPGNFNAAGNRGLLDGFTTDYT